MIYVAQWIKSKIQTSQKIDRLVHVHKCNYGSIKQIMLQNFTWHT